MSHAALQSQAPARSGEPEHPLALVVLVLGIVGVVAVPICAPIAWALSVRAHREMAVDPLRYHPSGLVQAGRILGIVGTGILCVGLAVGAAFLVSALGVMGVLPPTDLSAALFLIGVLSGLVLLSLAIGSH